MQSWVFLYIYIWLPIVKKHHIIFNVHLHAGYNLKSHPVTFKHYINIGCCIFKNNYLNSQEVNFLAKKWWLVNYNFIYNTCSLYCMTTCALSFNYHTCCCISCTTYVVVLHVSHVLLYYMDYVAFRQVTLFFNLPNSRLPCVYMYILSHIDANYSIFS